MSNDVPDKISSIREIDRNDEISTDRENFVKKAIEVTQDNTKFTQQVRRSYEPVY